MPYRLNWYIEGQITYARFIGHSNAQELRACLEEQDLYLEQGQRPLVHTIIDLSHLEESIGLVNMAQAIKGRKPDPRVGWVITIGEQNKVVHFTASVVRQILQMRQRSYSTLLEALDFLREIDNGIDWSKADNSILESAPQKVNVP